MRVPPFGMGDRCYSGDCSLIGGREETVTGLEGRMVKLAEVIGFEVLVSVLSFGRRAGYNGGRMSVEPAPDRLSQISTMWSALVRAHAGEADEDRRLLAQLIER